eukprot:700500-Pyramimonas_sp.AAC.1
MACVSHIMNISIVLPVSSRYLWACGPHLVLLANMMLNALPTSSRRRAHVMIVILLLVALARGRCAAGRCR